MGFLKSKQRSTNMEQPWVNANFKPVAESLLSQGQQGLNSYMGTLTGSDPQGFENFKQSGGYQNMLAEAMRGVQGTAASRGLLASGGTLRAMQDRSGQMANQTFNQYLSQLLGGSQAALGGGMQAGQVVADVGAQNERVGGLGRIAQIAGGVGKIAGLFSDRRLKDDVELIGRLEDGLGVYRYRYKWEDEPRVGVMADEVAELRPEALGPIVEGYATVNYGALGL